MQYKIEAIGNVFHDKDLPGLAARFGAHASEGYKLHTVFQVTQPGCLGMGRPSSTYLAVYVKD